MLQSRNKHTFGEPQQWAESPNPIDDSIPPSRNSQHILAIQELELASLVANVITKRFLDRQNPEAAQRVRPCIASRMSSIAMSRQCVEYPKPVTVCSDRAHTALVPLSSHVCSLLFWSHTPLPLGQAGRPISVQCWHIVSLMGWQR
jgi:hypothetical protein